MADPKFKVGDILKYTRDFMDEVKLNNIETARAKVIEINTLTETYRLETLVADNFNFYTEDEEEDLDDDYRWFSCGYIDGRLTIANTLEQYVLDTLKKHGVI